MIIKYKSQGCDGKTEKYKFITPNGIEVFKALPYFNYTLKQVNANINYFNKFLYSHHTKLLDIVFLVGSTGKIIRRYLKRENKFKQEFNF